MSRAKRLQSFRRQCERVTSKPASDIEVPLLHVLADICDALKLSKRSRRRVLGSKGWQHLEDYREWRVNLKD